MPFRRPLPLPPSASGPTPTSSTSSRLASSKIATAQNRLQHEQLPTGHDFASAWADKTAPSPSQLCQPLASLSLESTPQPSRRPSPAPRTPSFKKRPRMSDGSASHSNDVQRPSNPLEDISHYHRALPSPPPPQASARPLLTPRAMSFAKRHASFDTPREVPLPSPTAPPALSPVGSTSGAVPPPLSFAPHTFCPPQVFERSPEDEHGLAMDAAGSSRSASPLLLTPEEIGHEEFASLVGPVRTHSKGKSRAASTSVHSRHGSSSRRSPSLPRNPRTRTHELADRFIPGASPPHGAPPAYTQHPHPYQAGPSASETMHAPMPLRPERASTVSLPLQEPYHTLPSVVSGTAHRSRATCELIDDMVYRSATDWRANLSTPATVPLCRAAPAAPEPPAPPRVFTPPPPPEPGRLPHEAFLCRAPPPPEAWIAVETTLPRYVLHLNLPGVERNNITISARRRRVLHIAADGWERGGGHFERRIQFGYDAELTGVGAEFDGDRLRVFVPRKAPPPGGYADA